MYTTFIIKQKYLKWLSFKGKNYSQKNMRCNINFEDRSFSFHPIFNHMELYVKPESYNYLKFSTCTSVFMAFVSLLMRFPCPGEILLITWNLPQVSPLFEYLQAEFAIPPWCVLVPSHIFITKLPYHSQGSLKRAPWRRNWSMHFCISSDQSCKSH